VKVDQLIEEVRREHGVRLAPDDPVLVSVYLTETVVKALLTAGAAQIEAAIRSGVAEINAVQTDARRHATDETAVLIADGGRFLVERVKAAAAEAGDLALSRIREETQCAERMRRGARRYAALAGVGAALMLAAFVGWVLASSHIFG
jgi:hypothetical protein